VAPEFLKLLRFCYVLSRPGAISTRRCLPDRIAAYSWALLLARIFEYLPLVCLRCEAPMRLIAFFVAPPQV
jgi:hypothetical protein